jgi:PPK2 family polyphosphate:nucleotide phosphotransferase
MASKKISLADISTKPSKDLEKQKAKDEIEKMKEELAELQQKFFACEEYALLIIIQGMDASGKDGAVRQVFSGINPAGCKVSSFKAPTEEEALHDFLWRIHANCPARGMIQVFNRSHYEDILVPTVHNLLDEEKIKPRYKAINEFEKLLVDNNTIILKFYLHVSEEEQYKRIDERKNDPFKKWKYQEDDVREVSRRKEFIKVYEDIFEKCSDAAPWHIIPSDKNWYKDYSILKLVLEKLKEFKIEYPDIK